MSQPVLIVVAGPNGSGKTTLTNTIRSTGIDFGSYINPDDIAAELDGPYADRVRRAQSIADERRAYCVKNRDSFSFESVMSHPSKLDVMRAARDAGVNVILYFVATDDPQINVTRVANRVARGGHDVPEDRIIARYARTLNLLPAAVRLAHRSYLFDNSLSVADKAFAISPVAELRGDGATARITTLAATADRCDWVKPVLALFEQV